MPEMPDVDALTARVRATAARIDPELDARLESAYLRSARDRLRPDALERLRSAVERITTVAASSAPASPVRRQLRSTARRVIGPTTDDAVRDALAEVVSTFEQTLDAARTDLLFEIDALHERIAALEHRLRDLDTQHPAAGLA